MYAASLALTSATFASAMTNLIPAITFILAVSVGLERLALRNLAGKAKVLGTFLGVGGAMLLTFYKGSQVNLWSTQIDLMKDTRQGHLSSLQSHSSTLGALLAIGSCLSTAIWLIIQTKMGERYPCPYSSTALMSVMGSIQSIIYAVWMERDCSQWKLGWNIRLLAIAYSGILASGVMVALMAWCLRVRGPLFVSIFNPLVLVIVAIASSLFLNEKLHVGSLLGALLIVCGLYAVLWGKGKETKRFTPSSWVSSSTESHSTQNVTVASPDHTISVEDKEEQDVA
ncbi:EamA domain [Dillenia turbinata]|uniref:WAT1-related protein n=1 Tax=Dillenia turbinata TaxID=194707 RepID=A0AAN8UG32_9MAGN